MTGEHRRLLLDQRAEEPRPTEARAAPKALLAEPHRRWVPVFGAASRAGGIRAQAALMRPARRVSARQDAHDVPGRALELHLGGRCGRGRHRRAEKSAEHGNHVTKARHTSQVGLGRRRPRRHIVHDGPGGNVPDPMGTPAGVTARLDHADAASPIPSQGCGRPRRVVPTPVNAAGAAPGTRLQSGTHPTPRAGRPPRAGGCRTGPACARHRVPGSIAVMEGCLTATPAATLLRGD